MLSDIKGRFKAQRRSQKVLLILMLTCFSIPLSQVAWDASGIGPLSKELVAVNIADAAVMSSAAPNKIEEAKWAVVDDLAKCECGGHSWAEGFFLLDTNKKHSWGCLQFQEDTVIHYVKTLWGRSIGYAEAKIIALDKDQARQLAYDVIFKTDNKVGSDWFNCERWHGLDARVDLIKSLEN